MKQDKCAVCGTTKNLEHHHIIPKSDGGTDDETNFLTLCGKHHAAVHGVRLTKSRKHYSSTGGSDASGIDRSYRKRVGGRFAKEDLSPKRRVEFYFTKEELDFLDNLKTTCKCSRSTLLSKILKKFMNEIDLEIIR